MEESSTAVTKSKENFRVSEKIAVILRVDESLCSSADDLKRYRSKFPARSFVYKIMISLFAVRL